MNGYSFYVGGCYYCDKIIAMYKEGRIRMVIQQLEYRGLNLLDEIGSVEIAIDADLKTIHIYDTDHIVEPEYDFLTKNFKLSEGFWKMANVIKEKQLFLNGVEKSLEIWVESFQWIFYSSGRSIKMYNHGEMTVFNTITMESKKLLYTKYFSRLTDESLNGK